MSETIGTAYVEIRPKNDPGKFQADVEQDLHPVASRLGSGVGKLIGVGITGGIGAAAVGLGAVLKTGFGEVKDYSAGFSQLQAGIKSTGGAAGVTAPQLEALATKIQNYSGQTDDSIVASEKLLLTFTNIKNSGPDKIFDRATAATADLAAKMGGDASGAAIQLGKALNDPVKGITALTRVGVSFDEGQKKSIKTMVEAGNTIGAQKIILGELTKEFGGAAKAAGQSLPGQLAIAKRSFEDVSQNIVTSLLPVITKLLKFVAQDLLPGIQKLSGFLVDKLGPAFSAIGRFVTTDLVPVLTKLAGFFTSDVLPVLQKVGAYLGGALLSAFHSIQKAVQDNRPELEKLATIVGKVAEVAGKVLGPALVFLSGVFIRVLGGAIATAIGTIGGVVDAIQGIVDIVERAIGAIERLASKITHLPGVGAISSIVSKIPGFATGGTLPAGVSLVGEHGAELLLSPRGGERVVSHGESKALLADALGTHPGPSGSDPALLARLDAVVASNDRLAEEFRRQTDRSITLARAGAFA